MSQPIVPAPMSLAELPAEWIAEKRAMVRDYGYALRAGADASIEFKSLRPDNAWLPLPLPNRATQFTTAADRDAVLQQLQHSSI